jgi:tryptophan synthase alpha chain
VSRLDGIFHAARAEGRLVVSIYLTVGHPDPGASLELARAALAGGAEILEIGVPFSDPLADGPTIQAASFAALEGGVTLSDCLDLVRTLRAESDAALLLMGYVNPFLAAGWERLAADAGVAGADGFIIPDLPPEEAGAAQAAFAGHDLTLIPMLAPTSSAARLDLGTRKAAGFIYCVALTGTTGARTEMDADLQPFLARVRARTEVPLVVGFGISTPEHVARLRGIADGFIVGSAFVRLAAETDPAGRAAAAAEFVRGLAAAAR